MSTEESKVKGDLSLKILATVAITLFVFVGKDLYTRILDGIADNREKITELRIIVESIKR